MGETLSTVEEAILNCMTGEPVPESVGLYLLKALRDEWEGRAKKPDHECYFIAGEECEKCGMLYSEWLKLGQ